MMNTNTHTIEQQNILNDDTNVMQIRLNHRNDEQQLNDINDNIVEMEDILL